MKIIENKIVKLNLKKLIEDLLCAYSSDSKEDIFILKNKFHNFLITQSIELVKNIQYYINKNKNIINNKKIEKYFDEEISKHLNSYFKKN